MKRIAAPMIIPPALVPSQVNRQRLVKFVALLIGAVAVFYTGNFAWQKLRPTKISGAPFITQTLNDLTMNLVNREGGLRQGDNEVMIEFRDGNGQLVDVGAVNFKIDMSMPGMQMHGGATIDRTSSTGQYRAKLKIDMSVTGRRKFRSTVHAEKEKRISR